jgi:hypothetical protein
MLVLFTRPERLELNGFYEMDHFNYLMVIMSYPGYKNSKKTQREHHITFKMPKREREREIGGGGRM